jgi:hypothetical protein
MISARYTPHGFGRAGARWERVGFDPRPARYSPHLHSLEGFTFLTDAQRLFRIPNTLFEAELWGAGQILTSGRTDTGAIPGTS